MNELIQKYRDGENVTPDDIIVANLPLANYIAGSFAKSNPHLEDDFKGEAALALSKAVYAMCKNPKITAPSGYAYRVIVNACIDFLRKENRAAVVPTCGGVYINGQPASTVTLEVEEREWLSNLTDTETSILANLLRSQSQTKIAKKLGISRRDVNDTIRRLEESLK